MIHITRQNHHFATQFRLALTFTHTDPAQVQRACSLSPYIFKQLLHGRPGAGWERVVAWFTYGPDKRVVWPPEEWLWDGVLEKLWPPLLGGPHTHADYLQAICYYKGLYLWEIEQKLQCANRGPLPKRFRELTQGAWLPSGLCLLPVLGLALKVPIRPFLPRAWPVSSKT